MGRDAGMTRAQRHATDRDVGAVDELDQLAAPGGDLLDRVDRLLTEGGAPADHAIWPLVRRLRALPGDAAAAVVAFRPESLAAVGSAVHRLLPGYARARADLAAEVAWEGAAAAAFEAHRGTLAAYLDEGPDGAAGRLAATAEYAHAVADWMAAARMALARTLAEVLGSAEAVVVVAAGSLGRSTLVAGYPGRPVAAGQPLPVGLSAQPVGLSVQQAAAEIGVRVLSTAVTVYEQAEVLLARWRPALAEVPYRPPAGDPLPLDADLRIGR